MVYSIQHNNKLINRRNNMYERQENLKLAYSIPEIAKLTGLSVSYLYRLSSEGKLPVCKIGTRCVITSEDLHDWLEKNKRRLIK